MTSRLRYITYWLKETKKDNMTPLNLLLLVYPDAVSGQNNTICTIATDNGGVDLTEAEICTVVTVVILWLFCLPCCEQN